MRKRFAAAVLGASLLAAQAAVAQSPPPLMTMPGMAPMVSGPALAAPQAVMRHAPGIRPSAAALDQPGLPPPPPPARGPQFRLRAGMMQMDVFCGENSNVKDCAEAAANLMDRFDAISTVAPVSPPPAAGTAPGETPSPDAPTE